jgi:hypothetical protein
MEYVSYILTFLAGLGSGWALKVVISSKRSSNDRNTSVSQKNLTAGGDIVAGDMNKTTNN